MVDGSAQVDFKLITIFDGEFERGLFQATNFVFYKLEVN
jgi:hypothetical protein